MSKEFLTKYEHEMGLQKKYSTEYKWTLNNWSLLYESTYKKGVVSTNFYLNGTNGYTCNILLSPTNLDGTLTVQFSDTQEIKAMKVICSMSNNWSQTNYYSRPVSKSYTYQTHHLPSKGSSDQTLGVFPSNLSKDIPTSIFGKGPPTKSSTNKTNGQNIFVQPTNYSVDTKHVSTRNGSTGSQPLLNRDIFYQPWVADTNETIIILIKITIMTISDSISPPNPTALPPVTLSKCDYLPRNILANFKCMFDRKAFCDVSLVLGDKTFYAHKAVLAAQSTVFAAMFLNDMKEQKDNKVEIVDRDVEVFEHFLNYLYGKEVTELEKMVGDMIAIADFYDVPDLKNKCESIMVESLTRNNVVEYVILADKFNCRKLVNVALRLIRNSATIMEEALLENDSATIMSLKEILSKNRPAAETTKK